MVLISNKYKFIFISTHRTANTETWSFLIQFCDEPYVKSSKKIKKGELHGHSTAVEIKNFLIKQNREHIWNTYTKICNIRNLYDCLHSHYGRRLLKEYKSFNDFINNYNLDYLLKNNIYDKLTIDNKLIIDKFIIFEDYEKSINIILKELKINKKYIKKNRRIIKPMVSIVNTKNSIQQLNQNMINKINDNEYFIKIKKILNEKKLYLEN